MRIKNFIASLLKKFRTFFVYHPQWIPHLNGKSLTNKEVVKSLAWHFLAFIWGVILIIIGKTCIFEKWKGKIDLTHEIDSFLELADKCFPNYLWLNLLITITVLLGLFIWLKRVWKDQYLSLNRMMISVWLMILFIILGKSLVLALGEKSLVLALGEKSLVLGKSFKHVLCVLGVGCLYMILCLALLIRIVFELKKLWSKRWQIGKIRKKGERFITEIPQAGLDKKVRVDYAKKVVRQLLNTKISDASFAVGITNEWGSGKTSFLLDMKNEMEGKCYILDFKPWNCQTPDQIINEFFELFRKKIKDVYSPLQKPILRYAQLLSDVGLPSYVKPIFNFLPKMEQSIENYKTKIEEGLKQLDKPIVVTIDDIDRLAADEMFEVLRLIRNTAAFPNLIYVVCYDKDYVVRQIQKKGISESDLYLEKIFPLELSLPKTEEESLMETFRHSLIYMNFMHGRRESLIRGLTHEDELMLVRLLPTYRKMKRFARLFVTNGTFITKKVGEKNIDLYDLLLIELLHFCRQDVYVTLRDKPEELLYVETDDRTKQVRYYLKNNILEILKDKNLSTYEVQLLYKCFDIRADEKTNHLAYVDSYMNYFCMSTPTVMISKEEFISVISDRSTIRKNVHNWFWKLPVKKTESLYSRMMGVRKKELSLEEWKSYVYLMIAWMCEANDDSISKVFEFYLLKDNLRIEGEENYLTANQYLTTKLLLMVKGQKVNRTNVAKVLCGFYDIIKDRQSDFLLNCEEIIQCLRLNFNIYMGEKPSKQDAINVVALNGNDLNLFVKANHIAKYEDNGLLGSSMISCENLIIDLVIEYFGRYEEKSSHIKEAQEMYGTNLNRYKTLPNIKNMDLEQEKKYIFGNEDKYQKYLDECFVKR